MICWIHPGWVVNWKEGLDFNPFQVLKHCIISWIHWTWFVNWQKNCQTSSGCCAWNYICTHKLCVLKMKLQHCKRSAWWSQVTNWNMPEMLWGLGIIFPLGFSVEYQLQNTSEMKYVSSKFLGLDTLSLVCKVCTAERVLKRELHFEVGPTN